MTIRAGSNSLNVKPRDGTFGESSISFGRYADGAEPPFGDTWLVGQSIIRGFPFEPFYNRSFAIVARGVMNGALTHISYLMITPNGHVIVHPTGSISSPTINTTSLNINGTNISILYQSKADLTNYKTIGTLTNDVNITGNQTITGKTDIRRWLKY